MKTCRSFALFFVSCLIITVAPSVFAAPWMGHLVIRDSTAWPDGRAGNYGTVKYFIDEAVNETIPLQVYVQVYGDGHPQTEIEAQVFTNLNRRDQAKVWEDASQAGLSNSYYATYPMAYVGQSGNNYIYRADLTVQKTGIYRLTARFRINNGQWQWHNASQFDGTAQRDCAVVVSPKKVLGLSIYEVNPLVVEALPGGSFGNRSSFEDFTDHDTDGFDPFSVGYVRNSLGFNTLWLMPIHPVTQERWEPNQKQWIANYSPGSPYATRNYWAVSEALSDQNNEAAALSEFLYTVDKAEELGLNVFIDMALNHAGRDVVYGKGAVDLGLAQAGEINSRIVTSRPAWCSNGGDYRRHAGSTAEVALYAPSDRLGEHSWYDAGGDWFFGDYSSLGPKPGFGDTWQGGALDERDLLYTDLNPVGGHDFEVENLWNYFAYLLPYWLDRTGNKLDGIRADFAQGLPPQAWEYIINKTRQRKWDFIFLGEALDPDQVRYRVNRHFDLITTVDHWLYRKNDVTMSQLVGSLESEAGLYGYNAAIMHNGTSHDEEGNGNCWLMLARYAVASSMYGVPMAYMGQPLCVPQKVDFQQSWQDLKQYWDSANSHVYTVYRRINKARDDNAALRSTNRYFLSKQYGGGFNENIFSAARWEGTNLLLVFVNLRDQPLGPEIFGIPGAVPLDKSPGVTYQAYNLVADDPNAPLWPQPRTAADIYQNGVYVKFNFPNETQYLRLKKI
ncbi:MAG: hypothetical protein WC291_01360 [Thermodesulfovibrionales bacterium]|jgi:hypothetical protein